MDVESDQSESPTPISEADFVRLFARHELALRNYARLILPDWSSVDDVLQDASITMWESRQRLRDESGFLPWGKVIVRHKCFNAIAKMRRDRLVLDKNVLELIAREEEAETDSENLIRIQHSLAECLGELTPERRELVLAHSCGCCRFSVDAVIFYQTGYPSSTCGGYGNSSMSDGHQRRPLGTIQAAEGLRTA